jgi:hypothetical protein
MHTQLLLINWIFHTNKILLCLLALLKAKKKFHIYLRFGIQFWFELGTNTWVIDGNLTLLSLLF